MHQSNELTAREILARLFRPLKDLFDEPLPRDVGYWQVTGSLCLFFTFLQIVTGILMAFYYTPSPDSAWESVRYVQEKVTFGRIIHGLHHWGSSGFVVMVFIHMLRVFTFGAYKGRRKWTWVVGVGLLLTVLGFGFTGYLLPWDMKAYFGTQVGTNIVAETPIVGGYLRHFLLGGEEISELTLPRFYALHVLVLPIALVALIAIHLYLVRLYGITAPWKRDDEPVEYPQSFFPAQALRDSSMIFLALCLMLILAWGVGGNLEEKADPQSTSYAPHPEWYFLGLQELLRYFPGKMIVVGTFILPLMMVILLLALPFIDRNPERRISKRPLAVSVAGVCVIAIVALTYRGYTSLQEEKRIIAAAHALESDPAADFTEPSAPPPAPVEEASSEAMVALGQKLYEDLECADCHTGEEVGRDLNIPPSLGYAGDRFTPGWMMRYLREVPPRRYESKGKRSMKRMPDFKFTDSELTAITSYLMTMRKPELFADAKVDPANATPEKIEEGQELYLTESCGVCHAIAGQGGKTAPDLAGVGSRLTPEFIFEITKHPQSLVPETTMEDSLLGDEEIESLTQYLLSLK